MAPTSRIGELVEVAVTELGSNTLFGALTDAADAPGLADAGA
jgi:hypothetical protein